MKILVVSDTHGDISRVEKILKKENEFKMIIHLGDYFRDADKLMDKYPNIKVECVYGNCDFMVGDIPAEKVIELYGKRLFLTHGHRYSVKSGYDKLIKKAEEEKADILLFGHTHISSMIEGENYILLNPGSISDSRDKFGESYAVLEVDEETLNADILQI